MVVDWYVGKRCNFDCSYCSDIIHDQRSPHVPLADMQRVVDILTRHHGRNISWSLTGGEPTLHPDFLQLCSYMRERDPSVISITTNGFRPIEYLVELFNLLDCVVISLHLEAMAPRLQLYVEKILQLEEWKNQWNRVAGTHQKTLIVRIMVAPGQSEQVQYLFETFKDQKLERCELRMVKGPNYKEPKVPGVKRVGYEDKFAESERAAIIGLMKEERQKKLKLFSRSDGVLISEEFHYNDLVFHRRNSFKGWHCWAGLDHIKIDPAGEIFRGSCFVGGSVGNIYRDPHFQLPSMPIVCDKLLCGDNMDLRSRKVKQMDSDLLRQVGIEPFDMMSSINTV